MRIRLLHITGTFHGVDNVQHGQVVDVDEVHALRYIANGLAEAVDESPVEESAVLTPVVESATVKRRGRSKKQPDWHDEGARGWSEGNPQP